MLLNQMYKFLINLCLRYIIKMSLLSPMQLLPWMNSMLVSFALVQSSWEERVASQNYNMNLLAHNGMLLKYQTNLH